MSRIGKEDCKARKLRRRRDSNRSTGIKRIAAPEEGQNLETNDEDIHFGEVMSDALAGQDLSHQPQQKQRKSIWAISTDSSIGRLLAPKASQETHTKVGCWRTWSELGFRTNINVCEMKVYHRSPDCALGIPNDMYLDAGVLDRVLGRSASTLQYSELLEEAASYHPGILDHISQDIVRLCGGRSEYQRVALAAVLTDGRAFKFVSTP